MTTTMHGNLIKHSAAQLGLTNVIYHIKIKFRYHVYPLYAEFSLGVCEVLHSG